MEIVLVVTQVTILASWYPSTHPKDDAGRNPQIVSFVSAAQMAVILGVPIRIARINEAG